MDFALPEIGEGVYEAELVRWLIKTGDTIKRGQPLVEVMTDKATMEVPSPFAGTITALRGEPGEQVKVGQVLLTYTGTEQPAIVSSQSSQVAHKAEQHNGAAKGAATPTLAAHLPIKAAPSVRQLARQLGVDLATIAGSGPGGRVLMEDLSSREAAAGVSKAKPEPKNEFGQPGTRIKLQGLRRRIAEHLTLAKRTIPHYSLIEECEVTELVKLRQSLKESFTKVGISLTYLPFFVKAVVTALKEVPLVNASLDETAGEIVLHDRYNIGIAVATPAGLMVPVVHDADKKDLAGLAREINRLGNDARAGRLKLDDLRGGTFTITSVGNVGGLISTPVINHPEVGILGLGRIARRPVFDEHDQVRPAQMLYLSMSFDHRVVDGAVAVAFTNIILRELKNPAAMLTPVA